MPGRGALATQLLIASYPRVVFFSLLSLNQGFFPSWRTGRRTE
jgi:hypothetical protein